MCGRYNITPDVHAWLSALDVLVEVDVDARYNVAPGQTVPVIIERDGRLVAVPMRWGFVPHWQKEAKPRIRPVNARDDHVASSGMFRDSWRNRRCLVPAGGFYEWKAAKEGKRPFLVHRRDARPFAMGGIWDRWPLADGTPETFAIITTTANDAVLPVHERMPVILPEAQMRRWLEDEAAARTQLAPCPSSWLEVYEIGARVNSPKNDDAALLRPLPKRH